MKPGKINIGTSGWHYEHWRGPFYDEETPSREFLAFYCRCFRTAEINNTFYQLPEEKTLAQWRDLVPDDFLFAVKASRYITHMKKLKDPEAPLETFFGRIETLGEKLGPVLFQLPPRWKMNPGRLRAFLSRLPAGPRCAFEFRDGSWFDRQVYDALSEHNAAFCIFELAGQLSPREVTADFVYIRLHGPGGAYQGEYGKAGLAPWAGAISTWSRQGKEVYCYFDNDQAGYAALDALRLKEMVGG